jgi:hypothetical protein
MCVKCKVHSITSHESPEGEESWYSSTISLSSALEGVGGQRHAPATLSPGVIQYLPYGWLGGPRGLTGWVRKNLASNGIRSTDRQSGTSHFTGYAIRTHCACKLPDYKFLADLLGCSSLWPLLYCNTEGQNNFRCQSLLPVSAVSGR